MSVPSKVIIENLFFSPWLFVSLMILIFLLPPYSHEQAFLKLRRVFILGVVTVVLASAPFFWLFSMPLRQWIPENQNQQADVIVVASSGIHHSGAPSPGSATRAYAAAKLYWDGMADKIIITGGIPKGRKESEVPKGMLIILQGMGVPEQQIIVEAQSFNTYENGINTAKILEERQWKRILLVSHDYHLPRLSAVFSKLGYEVLPYAANSGAFRQPRNWWEYLDWDYYNQIRTIAHEYIGLLMYFVTGKV